jgi:hypothetical protein
MSSSNTFKAISNNIKQTIPNQDESIRAKLDDLAIELATNYCTVSFGEQEKGNVNIDEVFDDRKELYHKICQTLYKKVQLEDSNANSEKSSYPISDLVQHRNILIIGAGATYDSYKCIPIGSQVIDRLDEKYKENIIEVFPALKEKFFAHLKELDLQKREPDFENMLSLYSELILTPKSLLNELSQLFHFKFAPNLFYEIVAHLFKHSFIDVIVNFNFDELLDRTIEEELGKENYHHILSDGDCVSIEEIMVDGRLKVPIYIKPHGTMSHKSSLRFTKRHYLDVPEQIKELLEKLISGERGEVPGMKEQEVEKIQKINIISAGFNMESLEIGDILNECLPKQSKIFHVCFDDKDKRDPNFINRLFPKFYERAFEFYVTDMKNQLTQTELHNKIYSRIPVKYFNKTSIDNKLTSPFSEIFSYVWRSAYYLFREDLRPRSIARHEIVSYLFYDPQFSEHSYKDKSEDQRQALRDLYEESVDYFLDRTIVEIAITINRNNGIVDISQLLNDRAGFYYKKYRETYFKLKRTHNKAKSIYDLINLFLSVQKRKNPDTTYSKNIFELELKTFEQLKIDEVIAKIDTHPEDAIKQIKSKNLIRWIHQFLTKLEPGQQKIEIDPAPLIAILRKFKSLLFSNNPNKVATIVLYRLFLAESLSERFIKNFILNYNKQVFNGNLYERDTDNNESINMLEEIVRLFLKSGKKHYYSIRPKFNSPQNYLTQSFSSSKILHTNLSVEYAYRQLLIYKDWDIALMITETGSIFNFLENNTEYQKSLRGKKIIVLNSYDAIKKLHDHSPSSVSEINDLQNGIYASYLKNLSNQNTNDIVYTFSLPAIQHNHHMFLFIKKVSDESEHSKKNNGANFPCYQVKDPNNNSKEIVFEMVGGMYIYRQGFSNNLNPILIGITPFDNLPINTSSVTNDFKRLMRIFSTTFCRALAFEGVKHIHGLDIDFERYQKWQQEEEVSNIGKLLTYLDKTNDAKFIVKKTIV